MSYFKELPKILYPSLDSTSQNPQYVALTNILTRSAFLQEIMENAALFYEYQVKDGETPEIIADKLYGSVDRFWIVLLFNNLSNPYYDFPLVQEQLNSLIESKYSQSLAVAQSTIHHHEERITRTVLFNGIVQEQEESIYTISPLVQDANTGVAVARPYLPSTPQDPPLDGPPIDPSTFANGITVTTTQKFYAISNYDYEFEENEKRRSIRLLDAQYVGNVENEFRRLMRNGN